MMSESLQSSLFGHNAAISFRLACDGQDILQLLCWTGVSAGINKLTLIIDDADASDSYLDVVLPDFQHLNKALPEMRCKAKALPVAV